MPPVPPFVFRKVIYLVEATGRRAASLDELLRVVSIVDPRSIGFHMHREFLAHKFVHTEFANDFAYWVAKVMGDELLAERLANLVVFRFRSLESLRAELARLTADHLLAHPEAAAARAPSGREFYFATARSIVMDTGYRAADLPAFAAALTVVPSSSIFFHFFETRFGGAELGPNDFAKWIELGLKRPELAWKVANIDPYMFSLEEARGRLLALVADEVAR
jgi:hypothetical protein